MKSFIKFSIFSLFIILSSCIKENPEITIRPTQGISGTNTSSFISVTDLKVGDILEYSLFLGESYFDSENQNFDYTSDFLKIEIVEELENGFRVKEWIDQSSNMFTSSERYFYKDMDAIFYNNWIIENEIISIVPTVNTTLESHLFINAYKSIKFPLEKFNGEEIEITSWKTDRAFSDSNSEFFVRNFELLNNSYNHLNVLVVDGPMAVDANGNTYIYNDEALFVRVVTYSAWTGRGIGWDRLN